jgi:hypothetical protein
MISAHHANEWQEVEQLPFDDNGSCSGNGQLEEGLEDPFA